MTKSSKLSKKQAQPPATPPQTAVATGRVDRAALTVGFDLSRQDQSFSFRMREITKLFERGLSKDLRAFDVTLGQWQFLRALWEQDGFSQQELSSKLRMTSAATVFSVNLLERDGLAVRAADRTDSRRHLIYLTPKGHALRKQLIPFARDIQVEALEGFTDDEIAQLDDFIKRMKHNLTEALKRREETEPATKRKTRKTSGKNARASAES